MANIKNPLVSIIVPVYNVEQYIRRCIDSILNQSYKNIELIIVDDGSTDSSPQIIKEYIDKAIIVTQRNKGQAAARNTGLSHATGDFLCFVDSDDYLLDNAIMSMIDTIQRTNADLVCGLAISTGKNETKIPVIHKFKRNTIIGNAEIIKDALLGYNIKTSVWAKLYDARLILNGNCKFIEGLINEDQIFTSALVLNASKVALLNCPVYYIEQRPTSTSRNYKDENITVCHTNYEKLQEIFKSHNKTSYDDYLKCQYVTSVLYTLLSIAYNKEFKIFSHYYSLLDISYFNPDFSNHVKLKGALFFFIYRISLNPRLFYLCVKVAKRFGYKRYN